MNVFMSLLFVSFLLAGPSNKRSGEYILTNPHAANVEEVKASLKALPPDNVLNLGKGNFLLRYGQDPGASAFKVEGLKDLKIQKNLPYKALKKK